MMLMARDDAFARSIHHDAAVMVIAQLGQSLDGRIATPTGSSKYINGTGALDHLHRLRASVDAVIVGVATVIADDPLLTVRRVQGANPARVIIDPNGRMPHSARLLHDGAAPVYVIRSTCTKPVPGARVVTTESDGQGCCPRAILRALSEMGLRRVLVEGGAFTVSRFIEAGAVDRLHLLVAPVILGSGKPGLALPPIDRVSEAMRPKTRVVPLEGGDVLFDCDLRQT
jgi:riboflavin-specific deaminase-like protein